MEKILYTSIVNGYDTLKECNVITPHWRYICYTNDPNLKSKTWEVRYLENLKTVKDARTIKIIGPLSLFSSEDIAIWIDGSIRVNCDLDVFIENHCKDQELTLLKHPHRGCVYEEAQACIKRKKDDPSIITQQVNRYRQENYPVNAGMVGTGLIIRKNTEKVKQLCQEWFKEVEKGSKRDQLSFNYVARKMNMNYHTIPFNVLYNEFQLEKHIKQ